MPQTETAIHPFEQAGLGLAPFRYAGMVDQEINRDGLRIIGHINGCAIETKPGGTCEYCSRPIMDLYRVESSDGKRFTVGCECIKKISIVNPKAFKADVKRHQDSKADARILAAKALLETEAVRAALCSKPHPAAWAQAKGLSMLDYVAWFMANAGRSGKTDAAKIIERAAKS